MVRPRTVVTLALLAVASLGVAFFFWTSERSAADGPETVAETPQAADTGFRPRQNVSTDGYFALGQFVTPWDETATLDDIRDAFDRLGHRVVALSEEALRNLAMSGEQRMDVLITKAAMLNYEGDAQAAYDTLLTARELCDSDPAVGRKSLYSVIYLQGVAGLRRGENENCILCRGESSCIIPITDAARHINPEGSRLAIQHFTEYLNQFPDDRGVRWLLNVAHMTLGEHPDKVDPRYLVTLDAYLNDDHALGRFRDIGHRVGLNQLTEAGGAIMEDFDNDGLLDVVNSCFDPTENLRLLRNLGTGKFEDRSEAAGFIGQYGGLNCVQTDYNNDGWLDIFVTRGAWLEHPVRPSLLRNNRDGRFTDVTEEAGLMTPVNSNSSCWGDYDNDGWLDLFLCCERQPCRLYHNERDGTFREVAFAAGLDFGGGFCKGANWIDYDNDRYPDLIVSFLDDLGGSRLMHNTRDGRFEDVTEAMGIVGPEVGFSCWAWDYNNDGWLDIFNTCYVRSLGDVVAGLSGEPHKQKTSRLYRNEGGAKFTDVTRGSGLEPVFATMGSNFGDFDNDGLLDMYLGTGEPDLAVLVPNRMIRNLGGDRFADITASSGTGNLQKGHGVACGDWDRDGNVDLYIEMGGAVPGDKYHNILFQNPGHPNHWLTVKLIGEKSNKAAIGARIKVVTGGPEPRTIHRHVTSGSSFGANPLQQTIGLGPADAIATLEIQWPTTGTTQVFHDVAPDQAIEITEFAKDYRPLNWTPVPLPPES